MDMQVSDESRLPRSLPEMLDGSAFDEVTFGWRFEQFVEAGFNEHQSLRLAGDRWVDLHQACDLARAAGPNQVDLVFDLLT